MLDNSSNISQCDFAEVCPEVSLCESENFEFEDVVPFNVSTDRPQVSVKGKLFKSIGHWQLLGAPDFILSIIRCGYKIPFISTPPPRLYKNNGSAVIESEFVGDAILELLRDNRIEEVFSSPDIVNPLSVSVQSSGKKRLILDLRHINLHIYKQKFRCEDLNTIKNVFSKDFFVFSFDLKSGYHHVDIFLITENIWLPPGILVKVILGISSLLFYLLVFPVRLLFLVVKTTGNPLEVTGDPYSHIF